MLTGGCLCGKVRWRAGVEAPITVRTCWCRLCQAIGAGSATVNAFFRRADLMIEGDLADHPGIADSGSAMHRRFCPSCGVHLFSEAEPRPDLIVVRVGTFDDRDGLAPQMTIWTSEAPDWASIDPHAPRHERQAPPAA